MIAIIFVSILDFASQEIITTISVRKCKHVHIKILQKIKMIHVAIT